MQSTSSTTEIPWIYFLTNKSTQNKSKSLVTWTMVHENRESYLPVIPHRQPFLFTTDWIQLTTNFHGLIQLNVRSLPTRPGRGNCFVFFMFSFHFVSTQHARMMWATLDQKNTRRNEKREKNTQPQMLQFDKRKCTWNSSRSDEEMDFNPA